MGKGDCSGEESDDSNKYTFNNDDDIWGIHKNMIQICGECSGGINKFKQPNNYFKSLKAYVRKVMVPFSEQSGDIASVMDGGPILIINIIATYWF